MAPEQAAADPATDHRADLYAVGVTAYELLAGKPPFTNRSAQQLLAAHAIEAPPALALRRPDVPPAVDRLVMRLLAKNPDDRYQTALALRQALTAIMAGVPLPEPDPKPSRPPAHATAASRPWWRLWG